ncbi:hypothetical protein FGB62_83g01 [Gracilaria domingensis]|nr:hypothetical protein FGB62_83g01 [Gracilaria domingensis]
MRYSVVVQVALEHALVDGAHHVEPLVLAERGAAASRRDGRQFRDPRRSHRNRVQPSAGAEALREALRRSDGVLPGRVAPVTQQNQFSRGKVASIARQQLRTRRDAHRDGGARRLQIHGVGQSQ